MGTETPLSESHSASAARTGGRVLRNEVRHLLKGENPSRRGKESPLYSWRQTVGPSLLLANADASPSHKNKWVRNQPASVSG